MFEICYFCTEMSEDLEITRSLKFSKCERLRLRSLVERLFDVGHKVYGKHLRAVWRVVDSSELDNVVPPEALGQIGRVQVMTVVPKRLHKRAVKRVLLRRRIKEAYRLNRHHLDTIVAEIERRNFYLSVAFLYNSSEVGDYPTIEKNVISVLEKIGEKAYVEIKELANDSEGKD